MIHVNRSIRGGDPTGGDITTDPAAAPQPDDPYAPIIADFRAAMSQLKAASSERLRKLGLSMAQVNILYTVQRCGDMPMSRLADLLGVSVSNATGLVDRIEERGFVERTRVPHDRRVVLVRVTPAGTAMLEEVDALSDELFRTVLDRIDRKQLAGFAQAVAHLRAALDETFPLPAPDRHVASTATPRSTPKMTTEAAATAAPPV
jgi:DNA-binding MarR family transcriptional regulator